MNKQIDDYFYDNLPISSFFRRIKAIIRDEGFMPILVWITKNLFNLLTTKK